MMKIKNSLYSKVKTSMIVDVKKTKLNNFRTKSYDKTIDFNLDNSKREIRDISVKEKSKRMNNESVKLLKFSLF